MDDDTSHSLHSSFAPLGGELGRGQGSCLVGLFSGSAQKLAKCSMLNLYLTPFSAFASELCTHSCGCMVSFPSAMPI